MPLIAYTSRALYTPQKALDHPVVLVEDGVIVQLGTRGSVEVPSNAAVRDFGDGIMAPGFVDIHIHGSAGYDVMQADESGRRAFEQFLARHGVTAYYPTTVAAPVAVIESRARSAWRMRSRMQIAEMAAAHSRWASISKGHFLATRVAVRIRRSICLHRA